jgi:major membrane immunogen (membrane-anchored lipoprotein)
MGRIATLDCFEYEYEYRDAEYEYEYRDAEYEYERKYEQSIAPKYSIESF